MKPPFRSTGYQHSGDGVNVNIKMIKKWKIKMYIFQNLLLSLCFHKGLFSFLTVGQFFDANNAMTNATGKNGVNHGINHGVKETPSRE